MTEKPSRLLATALDLINNQNFNDAMLICEKVIRLDPNNINGLLLLTKCWMDLDIKYDNVKRALEKILILKPNNPTAIQALRKFYEKHLDLYFDDAVKFFQNLFHAKELIDKDYDIITKNMNKSSISSETQKFICDCLVFRIENNEDINSLKSLFVIAAQNFIIDRDRYYFDRFIELIGDFHRDNISSDTDELDYLRAMGTLFQAFIDNMEPELFYTLLEKNNLVNIYGYTLFADILCEHYLFSDCHDTLDLAFKQLSSTDDATFRTDAFHRVLTTLRVKNLVQWFNVDELDCYWPPYAIDFLPKYLWCQAYAVGFNVFTKAAIEWTEDLVDSWCQEMAPCQTVLCRAIMTTQSQATIRTDHETLANEELTSFQWYLWSRVLGSSELAEEQRAVLVRASQQSPVHFKNHWGLAELYSTTNDYRMAVDHLESALSLHWCTDILERLVELHMNEQQYEQPVNMLQALEVEHFSEGLLEKFAMCLNHLDRVTDAISIAQRLAKLYPSKGFNWQLLGDLYLKRGNINSAFTTYSRSMGITGDTGGILTRIGNVFSMRYHQTLDENDFHQSVQYFDRAILLEPTIEALEGETAVVFVHAEMALKQLMLSNAVQDVQRIIDLLTSYHEQLRGTDFYMNLLGKTIFLSINGSIGNLIDFKRAAVILSMDPNTPIDPYLIAFNCFKASIRSYPTDAEAYFNAGLLAMHKLNRQCTSTQRGSALFPELFFDVENHLKTALHLDSNLHGAWKYLGYLYFRHGVVTSRYVFDIQHCLSTAVNIASTEDSLKDSESAFWLGLLYIRENWYNLAKEVFAKIEMDYPVSPIGHIGMYLLAAKDHTVTEQSQVAKAILCYNYRDEESSLDDSCFSINDSVVGLFCDNLGFLVNSRCDYDSFHSAESSSELIAALKTTLTNAWIKHEALRTIGSTICPDKDRQYREYGCFLGVLELLTGNRQWGKRLIERSQLGSEESQSLSVFQQLDDAWAIRDNDRCIDHIKSLAKQANLCLDQDSAISLDDRCQPARTIDRLLLMAISQYLSSSGSQLVVGLESLTGKLGLLQNNDSFPLPVQASVIMCIGALITSTGNRNLATMFIEVVDTRFTNLDDKVDGFSRVLCRLRRIESGARDGFKYLHGHCLKQPYDMNRWLNLLEFGLEYHVELEGFVDISQIFFITNRPWCFSPFDVERYARILQCHSSVLTTAAVSHQKHMFMRSVKLFPHLCFNLFKSLFF